MKLLILLSMSDRIEAETDENVSENVQNVYDNVDT